MLDEEEVKEGPDDNKKVDEEKIEAKDDKPPVPDEVPSKEDSEKADQSAKEEVKDEPQEEPMKKESVGSKRKAEILSKESGKIGVTITTSPPSKQARTSTPVVPSVPSPPLSPTTPQVLFFYYYLI